MFWERIKMLDIQNFKMCDQNWKRQALNNDEDQFEKSQKSWI